MDDDPRVPTLACPIYRPDHNGECLLCDEWADAHTPEALAAGEQLAARGERPMPYYDTIEEDLARAREILAKGKAPVPPYLPDDLLASDIGGGTIYGADTYAAYKLLESFVAEIERLEHENLSLRAEKRQQFRALQAIRTLADQVTGTDRTAGDARAPGALGAVQRLVQEFTRLRAQKEETRS